MAIKGGDLIHVANRILVDRAQTAGPGQVNINKEKIYELGNYYSLASIYDTPDLSFSLESFDVAAEFEAILVGRGGDFNVNNTVQTVTLTGATGGTFTLTYSSETTSGIAYNASATDVQNALLGLTTLNTGDVTVTGTGPYTATFNADGAALMSASATGLTGTTPTATVTSAGTGGLAAGTLLQPAKALPMDIASAFKPGFTAANPYDVVGSVGIPFLQLESLSYRFGIQENASQSATLRGDSVFYNPASTFVQVSAGTNAANQVIALEHPAVVYHGDTVNGATVDGTFTKATRYVLSVTLAETGKRLLPGADYTETTTAGVTSVTVVAAVPTTQNVRIMYASTTPTTYPQLSHAAVTAVRPAAIRGRNVEVFIGGTSVSSRWTSVQSVSLDWRVTLNKDEELGNSQIVSQDFDVPEVTGSLDLKPRDYQELYRKICQVANVKVGEVAGPLTTTPLELLIVLHSPDDGTVLKTLEVPDARFTLPGYSGRAGVGQKMTVTFAFESDGGFLNIYAGPKP